MKSENPKNVLLLRHRIVGMGGAELVLIKEAEWFLSHGYKVTIATFDFNEKLRIFFSGCDIKIIEGNFLSQVLGLRKIIRSKEFTAVIADENGHIHFLFASLFLPNAPKSIIHMYGSFIWLQGSRLNNSWLHRFKVRNLLKDWPGHREFQGDYGKHLSFIERIKAELQAILDFLAVRNFDVVATTSFYTAGELKKIYGVEPVVIPGGVDGARYAPLDILECREKLGLKAKDAIIFTVNRLDPRKRIDILINAAKKLHEENENIMLVIAGTGPEEKNLKNLAAGAGFIRFLGFTEDEDLKLWYASSDVVAYPAWCAWGLVPLEALSMNKKVVISEDAIISEGVGKMPNVFISKPDVKEFTDALRKALSVETANSREAVLSEMDWNVFFSREEKIICA